MASADGVGAAQRGQIGGGLFGRRRIQIPLARDPGVAAFLAFGRFFQDDDLGSQLVGGDRSGHARRPEPDDDNICFYVPIMRH